MATVKQTSRVILNRAKVEKLRLGIADAIFGVALEVLDNTHPPDAPPYGKGLIEGGGAVAFVDKKKVNGTTIGGRQIKKPRSLKLGTGEDGIVAIVGYGFPGRLVHNGSIHNKARTAPMSAATRLPSSALIGPSHAPEAANILTSPAPSHPST